MNNFKQLIEGKKQELIEKRRQDAIPKNQLQKAVLNKDFAAIKTMLRSQYSGWGLEDGFKKEKTRNVWNWLLEESESNPFAIKVLKTLMSSKRHNYHESIKNAIYFSFFFQGNLKVSDIAKNEFIKDIKTKDQNDVFEALSSLLQHFYQSHYTINKSNMCNIGFEFLKLVEALGTNEISSNPRSSAYSTRAFEDSLNFFHTNMIQGLSLDQIEEYNTLMHSIYHKSSKNFKDELIKLQENVMYAFINEKDSKQENSSSEKLMNFWINWQCIQKNNDLPLSIKIRKGDYFFSKYGLPSGEDKENLKNFSKEENIPILFTLHKKQLSFLHGLMTEEDKKWSMDYVINTPPLAFFAIFSQIPESLDVLEKLEKTNSDFWIDLYKQYKIHPKNIVEREDFYKIYNTCFKKDERLMFLPMPEPTTNTVYNSEFVIKYFGQNSEMQDFEKLLTDNKQFICDFYKGYIDNERGPEILSSIFEIIKGKIDENYNKGKLLLEAFAKIMPDYCLSQVAYIDKFIVKSSDEDKKDEKFNILFENFCFQAQSAIIDKNSRVIKKL